MSKKVRVCAKCLRPVSTTRFIIVIGCTCPVHGRMDIEDTIKIPEGKANYTTNGGKDE